VAVGPEGGFTDAEVEAALAAGWRPVGLGPRTLRVETAALVLTALAGC
jgi:16S rRNA (uracil1498-N3)-methyltransferase